MMQKINKYLLPLFFIMLWQLTEAQTTAQNQNIFYGSQKFYVAVGVIFIILAGLISFLIYLERRARKLTKRIDSITNK